MITKRNENNEDLQLNFTNKANDDNHYIAIIYDYCKKVSEGKLEAKAASIELHELVPSFSIGSHIMTFNKFQGMLKGKMYKRGANNEIVKYFLNQILIDYGLSTLKNALTAEYEFIQYYYEVTGSKQEGIRKICQEISENNKLEFNFDETIFKNIKVNVKNDKEIDLCWYVNANFTDNRKFLERFIEEGIWENIDGEKNEKYIKEMAVGDKIAIKITSKQTSDLPFDNRGLGVSVMTIKAIGTITNKREDGKTIDVEWNVLEVPKKWYFFTYMDSVWKVIPKKDDWMYKALLDFTFNNIPQDIKRFLDHPYWGTRYLDEDNTYVMEIIAALQELGGKGVWKDICDKIEKRDKLESIHSSPNWRNVVNYYLQANSSESKNYKGKHDYFKYEGKGKPWILKVVGIEGANVGGLESEKFTREEFLAEAYITPEKYDTIVSRLNKKKNIILQGPPGVGKSFLAKKLAYSILGHKDDDKVEMIQFHQSYSYEDFIMGYRPNEKGGFDIVKGVFYNFCMKAIKNPQDNYYFIIDEINRGNMSKIFGELMLLIESDKRGEKYAMSTVYSSDKFYIPENIYLIGLMNTADRSLALLDYALRRRFSFIDIEPAFGPNFIKYTSKFNSSRLNKMLEVIANINDDIQKDDSLGKGFRIGHSYFCDLKTADISELSEIATCEIIPLLEEYWFDVDKKVETWTVKLNGALSDD